MNALFIRSVKRLAIQPEARVLIQICAVLLVLTACTSFDTVGDRPETSTESAGPRWFKGNLHTHSLWSDGDEYPEVIAEWYKEHGYHFLAISDHNVLQQGGRWFVPKTGPVESGTGRGGGGEVLERYQKRFGSEWVETREVGGSREVRLKPLDEYRARFEEPSRFLLIQSEEISARWIRPATDASEKQGPIHINAANLRDPLPPLSGASAVETIQKNFDAILEVRERTGQPILPHINHPNYKWAVTAEDLMQVRGARFFEVYNGHPRVNNAGDAGHLDTDAMWDAVLTRRLSELNLGVMFAVATDDTHHYQNFGPGFANSGRGWVMVRARYLTPESIVRAMEAGDFYASTGVTLRDVKREGGRLSLEIEPEPGVNYVIQFIGTRRGYDPASEEIPQPPGDPDAVLTMPHRRYSKDVGAVLAEVRGTRASYALTGEEIYVRARVTSSKPKANGSVPGESERAWTQPLVSPDYSRG